jgi:CheY-like chemotaxis protein
MAQSERANLSRQDPQSIPRTKRILIADDDEHIRRLVRKRLEESGWSCEEANNGVDAISKARAEKPDLVILDLAMPIMNGFEAALVLQREMPNVPLVMLTMYGDVLKGLLPKPFGAQAVVAKSEGMSVLIERVQRVFGSA